MLDAVEGALDSARMGKGNTLFVMGEAGLGKSSVLEVACRSAAGDMDVALARGATMEQRLPFGLIEQALSALGASEVLGLDGPAVEPSAPHYRVLRALRERRGQPVLLVLDDLHLADADSLSLLSFLARRLTSLPVALIGALRPWPPQPVELCRGLADEGVGRVERLAPLSRTASDMLLAASAGGHVAPDTAARAWDLCSGNPILVEQAGRAVARGERLPEIGGGGGGLGERMLLSRFAGLDARGLECAQAASILGARFRAELPAAIAGAEDRALDEALFRSGVLVGGEGGEVRFAHPLFAQALYEDLAPATRKRLHARAFAILVGRGLEAEAAEHAVRAELVGDERAIATLHGAGRTALAVGGLATAVAQLEAGVRLAGAHPSRDLSRDLCRALTATGRVREAIEIGRRLLAEPGIDWRERLELLCIQGRSLYLLGAADHGDGMLAEAATLAVASDAPELAVGPLLDQSLSAWLAGGPARALPLAAQARELSDAGDDPELRLRANAAWGHLATEAGDAAGFGGTAAVVARLADGTMALDPGELAWPWASVYHAALDLNYAERLAEAERTFRRAREVMEHAGAPNALATLAIYIASNVLRQGRVGEALAESIRAKEFAELTPGVVAYADVMRAEALAWAGHLSESETFCAAAEKAAPEQWFVRLWVAHVRGMCLLWRGAEDAAAHLLLVEELTNDAGIGEPCHIHWQGHAIAAHLAVGRHDDARRVIEWLERSAERLPCRWPRIAASLGRAQLAAREGDSRGARDGFRTTLALHAEVELPLPRVEALLAYGSFLRRSGAGAEARPLLAEAMRVAEDAGASLLASTARTELLLEGGRRRRRVSDRDELTAAEQRVAEFAAEGLGNADIARALFISVNTVETHLRHVYAKLGIHSRRELIARRTG